MNTLFADLLNKLRLFFFADDSGSSGERLRDAVRLYDSNIGNASNGSGQVQGCGLNREHGGERKQQYKEGHYRLFHFCFP